MTVVFYALLAFIVLSPLPFGSNREWSWSLCALIVALLGLLWVAMALKNPRRISLSLHLSVMLLFLLPVLWVLVQLSAAVPAGWMHPLWQMTAEALGEPVQGSISLVPDAGPTALMRLLSYGLVFFLSFQLSRDPERAKKVFTWIAAAGVLYALYGLVVYWGDFQTILWYDKWAYQRDVTSTLVNRNSYATLAGLGLLCAIVIFLDNTAHLSRRTHAGLMGRQKRIELFIIQSWRPLLGLMLLVTALVSTHSRGGFIATGSAVMLFLVLFAVKKKSHSKALLGAMGGVLLVTLLAYSLSSDVLLKRFTYMPQSAEGRLEVYEQTAEGVADNPWLGFGYGSFEDGFHLYRDERIPGGYDKAHNTYVENAFELGLPAALSLFAVVLALGVIAARGVKRRRRDWRYPAAGVAATLLVAIHSLVDFSLQIPAVAITYAAIMGVAVAQSYPSRPQVINNGV